MASHLVVIDSTARRSIIKVSPTKHLSEILEEACSKLGATAANSALKHNDKPVDLSRTFRLAGLSSGAKLHLVQISRSPSPVSVALQMPQSEGNIRLTDKFSSTTTLWLVLRKLESGAMGDESVKLNLTARGAPSIESGSSGSGRLYYQTPVVNVMGRELSSFEDLQKTLAQLGLSSGSTLLRLSFKPSGIPLEQAMMQISQYFKPYEDNEKHQEDIFNYSPPEALPQPKDQEVAPPEGPDVSMLNRAAASDPEPKAESAPTEGDAVATESNPPPALQTAEPTSTGRPMQVYFPPISSTPSAALTAHNPTDYVPTIEHATAHQHHLQSESRNSRLLSEAELADKSAAEAERLRGLQEVEIKIRFPDQSSAVSIFGQADSGADMYSFVREDCLDPRWKAETFLLSHSGHKGWITIPDSSAKKLIQQLGLKGRVLVNFRWDEAGGASMDALQTKDVLKEERRQEAQALNMTQIPTTSSEGDTGIKVDLSKDEGPSSDKKRKGMPKWLKLPGKK